MDNLYQHQNHPVFFFFFFYSVKVSPKPCVNSTYVRETVVFFFFFFFCLFFINLFVILIQQDANEIPSSDLGINISMYILTYNASRTFTKKVVNSKITPTQLCLIQVNRNIQ